MVYSHFVLYIYAAVHVMVILRSRATAGSVLMNMSEQMTSDLCVLFMIKACKSKDIKQIIRAIVAPNQDNFIDLNCGLAKQPLKLCHVWIIAFHIY